jgi:hypothetical protein
MILDLIIPFFLLFDNITVLPLMSELLEDTLIREEFFRFCEEFTKLREELIFDQMVSKIAIGVVVGVYTGVIIAFYLIYH